MTPGMIAIMFACSAVGALLGWALRGEQYDRATSVRIQRGEQQQEVQQEQIEQLTRQREQLREIRTSVTDQHHRGQRQNAILRETLDEANARIRTLNSRLAKASEAFESLKQREKNTRNQLKLMIRRTRDARVEVASNTKLRSISSGLQAIRGIGPALARQLEQHGYHTLEDIAGMSSEDIDALDQKLKFPGRIRRDRWVEQARGLVEAATNAA